MAQLFSKIVAFYQRAKSLRKKNKQSSPTTQSKLTTDLKPAAPPQVLAESEIHDKETASKASELSASEIPSKPFDTLKRPDPEGKAIAIHAWEPRLPDQLELVVGDKITIHKNFNDGWVTGRNETRHKIGIFPIHCVESYEPSVKSLESEEKSPLPGDEASAWKQVGGLWVKAQ
ncbi:hypothetical protein HDU96_003841 [Phlyctochytrium bullatum]|nr:hypothetical protein HDU96_003841 [Phlyctochytrium bullatum]